MHCTALHCEAMCTTLYYTTLSWKLIISLFSIKHLGQTALKYNKNQLTLVTFNPMMLSGKVNIFLFLSSSQLLLYCVGNSWWKHVWTLRTMRSWLHIWHSLHPTCISWNVYIRCKPEVHHFAPEVKQPNVQKTTFISEHCSEAMLLCIAIIQHSFSEKDV